MGAVEFPQKWENDLWVKNSQKKGFLGSQANDEFSGAPPRAEFHES